jgi:hypothetical protein
VGKLTHGSIPQPRTILSIFQVMSQKNGLNQVLGNQSPIPSNNNLDQNVERYQTGHLFHT